MQSVTQDELVQISIRIHNIILSLNFDQRFVDQLLELTGDMYYSELQHYELILGVNIFKRNIQDMIISIMKRIFKYVYYRFDLQIAAITHEFVNSCVLTELCNEYSLDKRHMGQRCHLTEYSKQHIPRKSFMYDAHIVEEVMLPNLSNKAILNGFSHSSIKSRRLRGHIEYFRIELPFYGYDMQNRKVTNIFTFAFDHKKKTYWLYPDHRNDQDLDESLQILNEKLQNLWPQIENLKELLIDNFEIVICEYIYPCPVKFSIDKFVNIYNGKYTPHISRDILIFILRTSFLPRYNHLSHMIDDDNIHGIKLKRRKKAHR